MIDQTNTNDTAIPPTSASSKISRLLCGAGLNITLAVASGFLSSLIFPPREIWWLAWIALIPMLIALRRTATVRAAGWLVLAFGIAFSAFTLSWLTRIFGSSIIGICALISLPWVLFGWVYRAFAGRAAAWSSRWKAGLALAAIAPVFWLATDWIRCEGWYFRFSWLQFGFPFASCPSGGVLYPFIGVYGLTFLVVLVNSVIVEVSLARINFFKKACGVAICALFIIPLSLYLNRPAKISLTPANAFNAAVVQHELGDITALKKETMKQAASHPKIIAWPEYALIEYPLDDPKLMGQLQDIARSTKSTLIVGCKETLPLDTKVDCLRRRGMMVMDGKLFGNMAVLIGPDGKVLGKYHKAHPIQFFSDGVPGTSYPAFSTPIGRIGVGICYDLDFASCPLRLVKNGAELLVIPTFDSTEWTDTQHNQHSLMAQARAAEVGRWIIRPTSSGVSQMINPSGIVTAKIDNGGTGSLTSVVSISKKMTWYVRYGYLLPFICLAITLLWLLYTCVSAISKFTGRRQEEKDLPAGKANTSMSVS